MFSMQLYYRPAAWRQNMLRGKSHRVTPLRHVLNFFPLVNLVNQFGCVIDQAHRRFTRHTGTAEAVDVGDAQAVKSQVRLVDLDKKLLPPTRRLKRKFNGEFLFRLADTFQQGTQRRRHWHGERPIFTAFRRRKCDFVFHKIYAVDWNPRFPQPAASVQRNIKRGLHPFRFVFQRFPNLADFSVGQFRFFRRLVPCKSPAQAASARCCSAAQEMARAP